MELSEHVSDGTGAFLEASGGLDAQVIHIVQDSPVDRLQTVADIRQRTAYDDAHRIVEIAFLHLLREV